MKKGFRALVVDDDDFSRATAVRILCRVGAADVLEAADGVCALATAERPGPPFDPVPLDADAAIAFASIVALGRQLERRIVAVGVEILAEWQFITDAGCDEAQGCLISRPLQNTEFETWLSARSCRDQQAWAASA